MKPAFTLLHKLPNRIRVKLAFPLNDLDKVKTYLLEKGRIKHFRYTGINQSLTLSFDAKELKVEDVLMNLIISLSIDNNFQPVRVFHKSHYETRISHYAIESGIAIGIAGLHALFRPATLLQKQLEFLAAGLTGTAVVEHGLVEIREKGVFDPEVVSIFYLINSVLKGKVLQGAAITWATTFARHIFNITKDGKEYQVLKDFDNEGKEHYHVVITQEHNVTNLEYLLHNIKNKKAIKEDVAICNDDGCIIMKEEI